MHIEKNICDNILGTVMGIVGKNKDGEKARKDLALFGIQKYLHLVPKIGGKYEMPRAAYALTLKERRIVCKFLASVKVPDGYSSNIERWVNVDEGKISGMKSHDSHVFIQDLIAPTFRGILPKHVYEPLVEFGMFFKQLCSKALRLETLERLECNIAKTLYKLEKIFPPSFFDVMVHLPIHLANEAMLAGPVHYRWMFSTEREMQKYKRYVRNRARPEGSIAEGYIANECLTFCSRYLERAEIKFNKKERNFDGVRVKNSGLSIFARYGKPLSKGMTKELSNEDWKRAQLYVLRNCDKVQPFIDFITPAKAAMVDSLMQRPKCFTSAQSTSRISLT
ncbi:uncharacterized protein [Euphorbia lathyris]|uniref:uncharacterized protein isoform X3 n=1 Tax=Euphorbia lathyris TaxID=212925 RepID=UPI003313835E